MRPMSLKKVLEVTLFASALSVIMVFSVVSSTRDYSFDETRIIVCYKTEDMKFDAINLLDSYHGRYIKEIEQGRLLVYAIPSDNLDLVRKDQRLSELVEYVELDRRVKADFVPNDTYWPQWNMEMIDVDLAWDVEQGDHSVIVAVLDTGVDYNHDDLDANVDETLGWDYVNNDPDPWDDDPYTHGTMVSGIICAEIDNSIGISGMAQITLMPMKVLDETGSGWTSDIIDAIYDAGDGGARAMNMSFGSYWFSSSLQTACNWAYDTMGILLAAAAGNDGTTSRLYPAAYDAVVGVGAVNSLGQRMSWSNYGDNVEIMAPGSWIWSTVGGNSYGFVSGTSIASPHVAGFAALAFSFRPQLTAQRIRNVIHLWAEDMGSPGFDTYNGWGLLDCWNGNG